MSRKNKEALGKGIRALLQDIDREPTTKRAFEEGDSTSSESKLEGLHTIELSNLEVNPFQPRADFDRDALEELAESIKVHGVIQPITVRKLSNNKFQLIAGERRTRASRMAGLTTIPAFVREADDQEMLEIALIENIQRENLNPLEVAVNYDRLLQECNLTQEALANRLGKSRSSIANFLRLLNLAPGVQHALKKGAISMGHGRALLGLDTFEEQEQYCVRVIERDMNVRDTEQMIKLAKLPTKSKISKQEISAEWVELRNIISQTVGTTANIRNKGNGKGEIVIPFKSAQELNKIIERLDQ